MALSTVSKQITLRAEVSTQRNLTRAGALLLLMLLWMLLYFPLGCAVSSSGVVPSAQQDNQAATSTGLIKPQFFGMVVRNVAIQPTVTVGSRRLWDPSVTWAALEPAPGSFTWTALDAEVAAAEAQGAEVTLTLGMTPAWASSQPTLPSAYGPGATAMPAHLSDWTAYLAAVATRYAGRIANYEVWNSPSDPTSWSGASAQLGSDMATLSAQADQAIHIADPGATIIAPPLDAAGLQQFLSAGGSASVAVFSVSISLAGQAPESIQSSLRTVRSVMANTSADLKPLWNDQPAWTLPSTGLSPADQAAYVARALLLNAASGVSRLSWYAWDENASSALQLTDANAYPTLAAAAYSTMESWLTGATINGCSANAEQLWSCQLVRNGAPAWILWSPGGTVQASSLGMSSQASLDGTQQAIPAGQIPVGAAPILLQ